MRRLVVVAASTLLLTGCAGATPLDPDTVAVIAPQNAGMEALLVGAIHLRDDCVTVSVPDQVDEILPVIPTSLVSWDGDELVVDGKSYADGAVIWLTGGFVDAVPDGALVPDGCPDDLEVFLVGG